MNQSERAELVALVESTGFRALIDGLNASVWVYSPAGEYITTNAAALAVTGRTEADLVRVTLDQVAIEEDPTEMLAAFSAAAHGEVSRFRATGVRVDGREYTYVVSYIPLVHRGEVTAVIGIAADETDLENARERERQLEDRLQRNLNGISDALYVIDRDWRFTYVNARGEALANTSAERMLGQDLRTLFPGMLESAFAVAYRRAMENEERVVVRDHIPATESWLEATAYPTPDGIAVYIRDITAEESARQLLLANEKRLAAQSALLDVATDAIMVRTLDHRIEYWNLAAEKLYGYPRASVIGRSVRELLYENTAEFDIAAQSTIRAGSWVGEIEQVTASGQRLLIAASWTLVRDAEGQPESIFTVNTDITARKRQERALLRAQRMESLGTLAGGIAHDLNNVLAPILMAAQLLSDGEPDPKRRELLTTIESGVKRGSDMIRQVLSFARGVEGKREPVDVDALIGELITFCTESLPTSITTVTDISANLWGTLGDHTQLVRVLMNLATNARDAMPDGGTLTIRARNAVFEDTYQSVTHLVMPGKYVRIEIEDSGSGIPLALQGNIFEPFFTTKGVGEGTGLGLATSVTIVRSHGGDIEVYSEPGRGSRFAVDLPALDAPAAHAQSSEVEFDGPPPLGSGELILVVDDEAAIRQVASQVLEANGYRTLSASNGAEALEIVATSETPIALVFTDMMMPVMDGATTAARLIDSHPALPIIATSGLNANGGVARATGLGVKYFLSKPYTTGELLVAVSNALKGNL